MADKELLELAAKAAGLMVQRSRLDDPVHCDFLIDGDGERNKGQLAYPWNPLADDGDALRLAATLRIKVTPGKHVGDGASAESMFHKAASVAVFDERGMAYQIRKAIVMVAAEIARTPQ